MKGTVLSFRQGRVDGVRAASQSFERSLPFCIKIQCFLKRGAASWGTGLLIYDFNFYYGDGGTSVAVDKLNNVYLAGNAFSNNFPVTDGAFQSKNNELHSTTNMFVSKFAIAGATATTVMATLTTSALTQSGSYSITAEFTGNSTFGASNSLAMIQVANLNRGKLWRVEDSLAS